MLSNRPGTWQVLYRQSPSVGFLVISVIAVLTTMRLGCSTFKMYPEPRHAHLPLCCPPRPSHDRASLEHIHILLNCFLLPPFLTHPIQQPEHSSKIFFH